jgi:hypothetical protein
MVNFAIVIMFIIGNQPNKVLFFISMKRYPAAFNDDLILQLCHYHNN